MQRFIIQLLAVVMIALVGGLAYRHLDAGSTPVVSLSVALITATPSTPNTAPAATSTPVPPPVTAGKASPGWGRTTLYLGKYRLTASSNAKLARTGQLTISLQAINSLPISELSGILSLPPPSQSVGSYLADFYLTGFTHSGMVRGATINLGSYTGPAVGTFVVKSYQNTVMVANVTFQGEPTTTLKFTHVTTSS